MIDMSDEPDPYGGRIYDMAALLAEPEKKLPWRTAPLTADGTLTILSARAGVGKTWLMYDLAHSVVTGTPRSGFGATHGHALIFDAEMGRALLKDRFEKGEYSPNIKVFNAMGLDLKNADHKNVIVKAATEFIGEHGGGLIGFDSLRRLCPSSRENDSDDMSPVVSWMAWLMREVSGAGLLIHHEGWGAKRVRGSSAILDQADAAWGLHQVAEDDDTLKLSCDGDGAKKPRYCKPPESMYLKIAQTGGMVTAPKPKSKFEQCREKILVAVTDVEHKSVASIARAVDRTDKDTTFKKAWASLTDEESPAIVQIDKVWKPKEQPPI